MWNGFTRYKKRFFDSMNTLNIIIDVPGEKIWIELKLILRGRYAGHIMRTILQQQFAPILGARRCFLLFYSNFLVFFSFEKVYLNHLWKCLN